MLDKICINWLKMPVSKCYANTLGIISVLKYTLAFLTCKFKTF